MRSYLPAFGFLAVGAALAMGPACGSSGSADAPPPTTAGETLAISSVQPPHGSIEGGTLVTLTGTGFGTGATVDFGGSQAEIVMSSDPHSLVVRTAPHVAGTVDVTVTRAGMSAVSAGGFTYEPLRACRMVQAVPSAGASNVPIVSDIQVTFSSPLDAPPDPSDVHLTELDKGDVSVHVALSADHKTVIVSPTHSLHFWASYSVRIDGAASSQATPLDNGGDVSTTVVDASGSDGGPIEATVNDASTSDSAANDAGPGGGDADAGAAPCEEGTTAFSTVVPESIAQPLRPASVSGVVRAGDTILTSSSGYRGLQVFGIDASGHLTLKSDLITPWSPADLSASGDRAYAPAGYDGVMIFDISTPAQPKLIGHFGTPGNAGNVALFDQANRHLCAVADGPGGVRIFDVTDSLAPSEVSFLLPPASTETVSAVTMLSGMLVVASRSGSTDQPGRFSVYDVTTPAAPQRISEYISNIGISALATAGSILYAGKSYSGIDSFDLSSPAAPRLVAHVEGPHGACMITGCKDPELRLTVGGDRLWVGMGRTGAVSFALDGTGAMTPANVIPVLGFAETVLPLGDQLLIGAQEGPIVYASDAAAGSTPISFDPSGHSLALDVSTSADGVAYVAAWSRGVQVFDIQTMPEQPRYLEQVSTPSVLESADAPTHAVLVDGKRVYVGDGRVGLSILDRTDPKNPTLRGSAPGQDTMTAMLARGNVLYACDDGHGLVAFDVTDIDAPVEKSRFMPAGEACKDIVMRGTVLYVASTSGLEVLDATDPLSPQFVMRIPTPEHAILYSVAAADETHLLVSTADADYDGVHGNIGRLQVFDVTSPLSPVWIWASDPLGGAGLNDAVQVRGDVAFVAARDAGVWIFDVSAPSMPVPEGLVKMPGVPVGVSPSTNVVYAVQGEGGLGVIRTGPLPAATPSVH